MEEDTYLNLIWNEYDHFIFDCDGVLADNDKPIGQSHKVLNYLQNILHKSVYVLSNYSELTIEVFKSIFENYNLSIPTENIYCSSMLIPKYLTKYYPDVKTVYYIGNVALKEQLENSGFRAIGMEDNDTKIESYHALIKTATERNIDAVVVGYDHLFTAFKIHTACLAISKGAKFLATNNDPRFPVMGTYMPYTGAILASIETTTGKKAEIVGKPSRFAFDLICEEHGIKDRTKVLVIGDTLETDIEGAKEAGIDSCFVGIKKEGINAKYVIPGVSVLDGEVDLV